MPEKKQKMSKHTAARKLEKQMPDSGPNCAELEALRKKYNFNAADSDKFKVR